VLRSIASDKENARPTHLTVTQTTQQQLQILLNNNDSDSDENGDDPSLDNRLGKFKTEKLHFGAKKIILDKFLPK
jgi:hypothetical protein